MTTTPAAKLSKEQLASALLQVAWSIRAYDDRLKDHDADLAERDAKTVEEAAKRIAAPVEPVEAEPIRQQNPLWALLQAYGDACQELGSSPSNDGREKVVAEVNAAWQAIWWRLENITFASSRGGEQRE